MNAVPTRKAFAVWFKDLDRWVIPKRLVLPNGLPHGWRMVPMPELARQSNVSVRVEADKEYKMLGIRLYGQGAFHRETVLGSETSATYLFPAVRGALIYNRLFAWKQSFALVPNELSDGFVSNEFPQFIVDAERAEPIYLLLFCLTESITRLVLSASSGSAAVSRNRFKEEEFFRLEVPLPPLETQRAIVEFWQAAQRAQCEAAARIAVHQSQMFDSLRSMLGTSVNIGKSPKAFALWWKDLEKWGVEVAWFLKNRSHEAHYPLTTIGELCSIGSGGTPSRTNPTFYDGNIPWVKTTEVRDDVILRTEETLTAEGLQNSSAKIYPAGSLLVAMYGQGATRGRTAKLGLDAATNQACAVLSDFSPSIDPDYVWFYLMSEYNNLRSLASGNNQPNLNAEMIATYPIPLPPLEVQHAIMEKVYAGRAAIAQERDAMQRDAAQAKSAVEAMILGAQPVLTVEET